MVVQGRFARKQDETESGTSLSPDELQRNFPADEIICSGKAKIKTSGYTTSFLSLCYGSQQRRPSIRRQLQNHDSEPGAPCPAAQDLPKSCLEMRVHQQIFNTFSLKKNSFGAE